METSNPLEKLIEITKTIKSYEFNDDLHVYRRSDGHYRAFPAISWSLGRKPNEDTGAYEDIDLLNDYVRLMGLISSAKVFVADNSNSKSRQTNIALSEPLFTPYFSLSPDSYAMGIYGIPYTVINNAQIVSDNLWDRNVDHLVLEEDISKITSQIDELDTIIRKSGIDLMIKNRMLETIGILRISVRRINITGSQEVVRELEKLLGQSVMAVATGESREGEDGKTIFAKTLGLFKDTKDLIDSASAIYPVLHGAGEIVIKALGGD
ncbi:hypothetical protein [Deinococcus wulumuqiensis]|uniref:hypothetical protein n=1 Tax=Deinococcus wulumuqiensis TaxID=980427 RepID=UPI0013C2E3DF|nr:hypothetical protein [Deinococcus wulumuqiensis]